MRANLGWPAVPNCTILLSHLISNTANKLTSRFWWPDVHAFFVAHHTCFSHHRSTLSLFNLKRLALLYVILLLVAVLMVQFWLVISYILSHIYSIYRYQYTFLPAVGPVFQLEIYRGVFALPSWIASVEEMPQIF